VDGFGPIRQFIAFDLETTGLSAAMDRIVEIAAVRFLETGEEIARFQTLVNPERPVPPGAFAVHGLPDHLLAQAPTAREVLPAFLAFLGDASGTALLAHNAAFDAGFLGTELSRAGLPIPECAIFDTLALARRRLPMLPSHRLQAVVAHLGLDSRGTHRAMADSLLVKQIWLRLEGHHQSSGVMSFKMFEARGQPPLPVGWAVLEQLVARGSVLQIEYEGGTRGSARRSITPRRLESRGGSHFLVAVCHIDSIEKSFRVDRIRALEFSSETDQEMVRVEPGASGG
jgi:DNA polymerase III subunit epsilon